MRNIHFNSFSWLMHGTCTHVSVDNTFIDSKLFQLLHVSFLHLGDFEWDVCRSEGTIWKQLSDDIWHLPISILPCNSVVAFSSADNVHIIFKANKLTGFLQHASCIRSITVCLYVSMCDGSYVRAFMNFSKLSLLNVCEDLLPLFW